MPPPLPTETRVPNISSRNTETSNSHAATHKFLNVDAIERHADRRGAPLQAAMRLRQPPLRCAGPTASNPAAARWVTRAAMPFIATGRPNLAAMRRAAASSVASSPAATGSPALRNRAWQRSSETTTASPATSRGPVEGARRQIGRPGRDGPAPCRTPPRRPSTRSARSGSSNAAMPCWAKRSKRAGGRRRPGDADRLRAVVPEIREYGGNFLLPARPSRPPSTGGIRCSAALRSRPSLAGSLARLSARSAVEGVRSIGLAADATETSNGFSAAGTLLVQHRAGQAVRQALVGCQHAKAATEGNDANARSARDLGHRRAGQHQAHVDQLLHRANADYAKFLQNGVPARDPRPPARRYGRARRGRWPPRRRP